MRKVYVAGHMLDKGAQLLRAKERDDIKELGYEIYNPADNKDINNKATAIPEGLAERIVLADTTALCNADVVVVEPQPYALGTHVELGQLLGMKDLANEILEIIDRGDWDECDPYELLCSIMERCGRIKGTRVYPHMEDIRRETTHPEVGDRRSWAVNQYVYGACLKLTDGRGFYEWEEILDELSKAKDLEW